MTDTTTPTGLTVEQWEDKYFVEHINQHYFKDYFGKIDNPNAMIIINEDLSKEPGDKVTFPLIHSLSGAGQTGSSTLEGNEEALEQRSFKLEIDQYRHAIRLQEFEMQKSPVDQMKAAQGALSNWNHEKDRNKIIDALNSTGNSGGKPLYKVATAGAGGVATGGSAASETQMDAWLADNADRVLFGAAKSNNASNDHSASLANIDASNDKLTASALSLMKRMAKTANPKIRPFKPKKAGNGSDAFILFAPPLLVRDLVNDSAFLQANREARERGKKNPIFTGADYCYENIAIIEVEDIPVFSGVGATSIDVAPCFLVGAQALAIAYSKRPTAIKEDFDYGDKRGRGIKFWYEIGKMQFGNSADQTDPVDHGVLTGYFAAVADS